LIDYLRLFADGDRHAGDHEGGRIPSGYPDISRDRSARGASVSFGPAGLQFRLPGVDIFFVISGYLMQHLYGRGITARDFYNRRARRILPAYYGVLIATVAVGFFVILPGDFQDTVN
jgi:hypothetical protein